MIQRRDLIVGGLGAGIVSLLPASASAAAAVADVSMARALAVFDPGWKGAARFGQLSQMLGISTLHLAPDSAVALYSRDARALIAEDRVLLGLTSYADYVVATGILRERGRSLIGASLLRDRSAQSIVGNARALADLADRWGYAPALDNPSEPGIACVFWAVA